MNNISNRLVVYLVGFACVILIFFGIRASASIINPTMLAIVITVVILPHASILTMRGTPGWLSLPVTIWKLSMQGFNYSRI